MWIALDIFGGDNAPQAVLDGAMTALANEQELHLLLCGDDAVINAYLREHAHDAARVKVIHAPEVIHCSEQPTLAIKRKKESSLVKALEAVAQGQAAAMVSAGSTGAVLTGATLLVRRLPGVKRPALAPVLPTATGCVLLIDCGANVDCKPGYLQQFAVMGAAYMEQVMGVKNPRVGLLNNGAEAEKGNELTKAAYPLLQNTQLNFAGNCEARDILSGQYDVLVCDGFAGNVVLKYTEGLASVLVGMLKTELMADFKSKLGAAIAKPAFRRFKKKMDYTEYGGAPLLGINGGIIKAHGSSNAKAITAALMQAVKYVRGNVTNAISEAVQALPAE